MIEDLKEKSKKWDQESQRSGRRGSPLERDNHKYNKPDKVSGNYQESHTYREAERRHRVGNNSPQLEPGFQPPTHRNPPVPQDNPDFMDTRSDQRPDPYRGYSGHPSAPPVSGPFNEQALYASQGRPLPPGYIPSDDPYTQAPPQGYYPPGHPGAGIPQQGRGNPQFPPGYSGQYGQLPPQEDPRYAAARDDQRRYQTARDDPRYQGGRDDPRYPSGRGDSRYPPAMDDPRYHASRDDPRYQDPRDDLRYQQTLREDPRYQQPGREDHRYQPPAREDPRYPAVYPERYAYPSPSTSTSSGPGHEQVSSPPQVTRSDRTNGLTADGLTMFHSYAQQGQVDQYGRRKYYR